MNKYLDPQYAKEIKGIERLTEEQTTELVKRIKDGDISARNELVVANLRLICIVVAREWRLRCQNMPEDIFMDLVQAGNMALLTAAERFEPDKGAKFSSYATACALYKIREEIKKHRDYLPGMSMNSEVHAKLPLDMVLIEEDGVTLQDILCDDKPDPLDELQKKVEIEELTDSMAQLEEDELAVLKYLYGIDCEQIKSYRTIGKKMGISEFKAKAFAESGMKKIMKIYLNLWHT